MDGFQSNLIEYGELTDIVDFPHDPAPWVPAGPATLGATNDASVMPAQPAPDTPRGSFGDIDFDFDFDFNDAFVGVPAGNQDLPLFQDYSGPHAVVEQLLEAETGQSRTIRRTKTRGPSASSWYAQRGNIKKLYIDEDKTLEETRKLMRDKYNFDATAQMYKEKFGDWGFSKNISRRVAAKLCRVADNRKPKDTTFRLGQKVWSVEEMRRKMERGSKDDTALNQESPVLPAELYWRTPSISPSMQNSLLARATPRPTPDYHWLPSRLPQEVNSPRMVDHNRPWSPSISNILRPPSAPQIPSTNRDRRVSNQAYSIPYLPPLPPVFPWTNNSTPSSGLSAGGDPLRDLLTTSKWQGKSLRDLQMMRTKSSDMASKGEIDEAISQLRAVVAGLESLLTPTHDVTKAAAYDLARILGHNNNMDEANAVLNWMNSKYVEKYGLYSNVTLTHYAKIVGLLQSWSREEDAQLLLYKVAELLTLGATDDVPIVPGSLSSFTMPTSLPETDIKELFQSPILHEDDVEVRLGFIEILLRAKTTIDLEETTQTILNVCERDELSIKTTIRARHCLSKIYGIKGLKERGKEVLDRAIPIIEHHFQVADYINPEFPRICKGVAFCYLDLGSHSSCEDVLEMIADSFTWREDIRHNPQAEINFLISVGCDWQKHSSWEAAAPWFERALLNSMRHLGTSHRKTKQLETTLEQKQFILRDELVALELQYFVDTIQ
ncbi:hypothetical protein F5Y10DRAFT_292503 [Nemania abortiva]|nr:hypothetical protein F5Y10DRAFT_292503 [Nemania abortiva]